METLVSLLIEYGAAGMFVAAFLAGSFFPFSSEVVMAGLHEAGVSPAGLLLWGTLGNVLGSLFNYGIGSLGKEEWITRYTKVTPEKLRRGVAYVRRYGPPVALLAWVPFLGSLITVALGYMRVNLALSMLYAAIGKSLRYTVLLCALQAV